jgi:hypothetical protein
MACCGQKRQQLRTSTTSVRQVNSSVLRVVSRRLPDPNRNAAFQYIGKTALTAMGPVSGRQYRFSYPGAIVEVDPRDREALSTVPNLRQAHIG